MTFQNKTIRIVLLAASLPFAISLASATGNLSGPVDQSAFVPIGGIEQWISIRGGDRANPVLLVVHGGPGEAQWPMLAKYKPWEKSFTVVQWDQRGTGHTFGRYGAKTPDVNLDRIAKDGIEVADYLCRTLGKKKIIVLGHSWGSIVAIRMVQTRPELFAAYVGTGQVASWKATVNGQFDLLLDKARRDSDEAKIKELEAIGRPDPNNAAQFFGFNKGLFNVMAPADQDWLKSLRASFPNVKASDPKEAQNIEDGMEFSSKQVLPDQMASDLPVTAETIDTPFFVIQGRDDVVTPTSAAIDYFNRVKAPVKNLVLIPDAGHFAFMTASDKFLDALNERVRPVAIRGGA
jgi:pimeloyl-ACP methyl ester carboxylesterase